MSEEKKDEQDERAAFEHHERASDLRRDDEVRDYMNPCVQASWEGWQARASSQKITERAIMRCNDCGSFDIEREETDTQTFDQYGEIKQAKQIEQYVLSVLPSVYYMDSPDGGDMSVLEQLRRMADDAAKYRAVALAATNPENLV